MHNISQVSKNINEGQFRKTEYVFKKISYNQEFICPEDYQK